MRFFHSQAAIALNQGDPGLSGSAYRLDDYRQRGAQLAEWVARHKKVITGHVRYDADLHANAARDYAFVTLLRDPVARFVSHYNYLQRRHADPTRAPHLEAFLNGPDARRIAGQYLFYFAPKPSRDPIDQALSNLARFQLVGSLERAPDFARSLRTLTGGALPLWRRNAAPKPTYVPEGLRARIVELAAPDIAIYQALHGRAEAA